MQSTVAKLAQLDFDAHAAGVLAIERACFDLPWERRDLWSFLRGKYGMGLVAIRGGLVVGYALFECRGKRIQLISLAVHHGCWREGIGSQFLRQLRSGLRRDQRDRIVCEVRESCLAAQQFLRASSFQACGVNVEYFQAPMSATGGVGRLANEDAITFEYRLDGRPPALDRFCWRRAIH